MRGAHTGDTSMEPTTSAGQFLEALCRLRPRFAVLRRARYAVTDILSILILLCVRGMCACLNEFVSGRCTNLAATAASP